MNRLSVVFPSRAEGLAFHLRLCDLDPVAPVDVCQAYLPPLLTWLAATFAGIDPDLRQSAAHQALMDYVRSPRAHDPARARGGADLAGYLRMAARGDLLNLLRRERKHHAGRVAWISVEKAAERGNLSGGDAGPPRALERAEEAQARRDALAAVTQDWTEEERRVLELMQAEERRTEVYAQVLGFDGRPAPEQAREVKKVKDRITKRLARGGT